VWSAVFAIAAAGVTTLLAGLIPALRASGLGINLVLRENSRGATSRQTKWLSQSLVVTEIALSFILLVLAGLTIQTSLIMQEYDVGVRVDNMLTVRLGLPEADYETPLKQSQFYTELNERIKTIPGVSSSTITQGLPGSWSNWAAYLPEGEEVTDDQRPEFAPYIGVANGYFEAFESPLLQGREFDERDTAESLPVVIVNQTYATKVFGADSPLGRQVRFGTPDSGERSPEWRTIVGVSRHIKQTGLQEERDLPTFYVPMAQEPARFMSVALRTTGEPKSVVPALRNVVEQIDPELPLYWIQTLMEGFQDQIAPNRILGICFGIFALIALVLAAGGLYGVISFNVIQRTPELGVRRALGADDKSIGLLVSKQAALQLGLGLGIGILGAVGASRVMESLILVSPLDPKTYVIVALLLIVSVIIATLIPSRRAMRIEPMAALRYD
ncbi:MAG: FtsX-like permease family protein, partial [Xanthomonadales bacterium]|nr:FtsX-like permease family protein [Xanthomonadales bacterium]